MGECNIESAKPALRILFYKEKNPEVKECIKQALRNLGEEIR